MKTFIFPGQGAQQLGMGQDLFARFKDLTNQADDILGYSIAELCRVGPMEKLSQTEYTQPALFVVLPAGGRAGSERHLAGLTRPDGGTTASHAQLRRQGAAIERVKQPRGKAIKQPQVKQPRMKQPRVKCASHLQLAHNWPLSPISALSAPPPRWAERSPAWSALAHPYYAPEIAHYAIPLCS